MSAKLFPFVMIAVFTLGGGWLGGGDKDAGASDLKNIQGSWKFVSQEFDGQARPPQELKIIKITFKGDKWSVIEEGRVVQAGTHKFDTSKKPAQVDAKVTEGEDKGATMLGIYELKGDTLKVCFDVKGMDRPTVFSSKGGRMLAVVEREKK